MSKIPAINPSVKQALFAAFHLIRRGMVISFELQLGGTILLLHGLGIQLHFLMLFLAKRHLVGELK